MTQEEKDLLLKDLCARLPYGVIVSYQVGKNAPVNRVFTEKALDELVRGSYVDEWLKCSFKPYLRPMSSMTEDEDKEWQLYKGRIAKSCDKLLEKRIAELHDWFNRHQFDFRGLIPMSLALVAPEGMYK